MLARDPLGERFGLAGLAAVVVRFILAWVLADLGEFVEAFTANDLHW